MQMIYQSETFTHNKTAYEVLVEGNGNWVGWHVGKPSSKVLLGNAQMFSKKAVITAYRQFLEGKLPNTSETDKQILFINTWGDPQIITEKQLMDYIEEECGGSVNQFFEDCYAYTCHNNCFVNLEGKIKARYIIDLN